MEKNSENSFFLLQELTTSALRFWWLSGSENSSRVSVQRKTENKKPDKYEFRVSKPDLSDVGYHSGTHNPTHFIKTCMNSHSWILEGLEMPGDLLKSHGTPLPSLFGDSSLRTLILCHQPRRKTLNWNKFETREQNRGRNTYQGTFFLYQSTETKHEGS